MNVARESGAKLPTSGRLLQVLGVGFGLAVTVGNTISTGILRTPGQVAQYLPDKALFLAIWLLGGLCALCAAPSFAELGTMIPRSGGHYVFARYALGEYAGFVIGWSDWLGNCGSTAAAAILIGEYSVLLLPQFSGHAGAIALMVVVIFATLQLIGIRTGSAVQQLSSLLKALAFMVLVAACFLLSGNANVNLQPPPALAMPRGLALMTAFVLALQAVIYTYDGWFGVIYFSGETRNPDVDVPRSMFSGTLSIMAIYLLVNAAIVHVLPMTLLAGKPLAMATVAQVIWGPRGDVIVEGLTIISMLGAINAYQLQQCRILFSMSVDGLFTKYATHVNAGGTPDVAHLLSTVAVILFVVSGTFEQVLAILAFSFATNYVVGLVSMLVLRRREPEHRRPYRAWGYPWTTGIALAAYGAFLVGTFFTDTRNTLHALVLLAASYPVFRLMKSIAR